ncbi:ABC-F family ATP-binding cassette domain-containing protein [Stenotrophomonas sp. LGBM10]|uniref:ABC-F family ATP-binding cassette domain-containing protein n=1 Tax=Stenotrophomonas sp. LGBM10 TaxID=3390038 RepID=UPI00398A6333
MTAFALTLDRVAVTLPDGRALFSDLSFSFDTTRTGLVGRNGVGKSVFAHLLSGERAPTAGRIQRHGHVQRLAQLSGVPHGRIIDLAGVGPVFDALARIEAGSVDPDDFTCVGERWDLREQVQAQWHRLGLPALDPLRPAATLSGGQVMQVALSGAFLSNADALVLDEPSNHLDAWHRDRLLDAMADWRGGLIVISHDRTVLQRMQRIVELSPAGLRSYGGNHAHYATQKHEERSAAEALLALRKRERRQQQDVLREQRERQAHRQSRAQRDARTANQAPILLGGMKNRSEHSAGRLQVQQAERRAALDARVGAAAAEVEQEAAVAMIAPVLDDPGPQRVASLVAAGLPWVAPPWQTLDLTVQRGQRIGIGGRNGSGKSNLLRVLAGAVAPCGGSVDVSARTALLDQSLSALPAQDSALSWLQRAHPTADEGSLRTRLALLGLDAERSLRPLHTLSGGERLKAALAAVLYAEHPPQLLLLDEPGNHLDLPSLTALEHMLNQYPGTLMVVSHDPDLLDALHLTHRLDATDQGWVLRAC